jgi:sec-independent protein translocase protein TatC
LESDQDKKMSFIGHLEELRHRIIVCVIAVAIGVAVCYPIKEWLFQILMRPLKTVMAPGDKMIFTGLTEAFFCYLKTALLGGLLLALPVIMYQMWCFIAPGLYAKERRFILPLVLLSCLFFIGGALFAYFIILPFAFKYLLSFRSEVILALPSMKEYFTLASILLLAFGLVFELPLVLTLLGRLGLVTTSFLGKNRKYAILLIFIAAAFITPTPDAVNQCLMAFPLMILYEVGILGVRIFGKKKEEVQP